MTAICPHCGYDLIKDEALRVGRYYYDPRGAFAVDDVIIDARPQVVQFLGDLLRAKGRVLTAATILDRLDCEPASPNNYVRVLACHARSSLRPYAAEHAFESVWGRGYRWAALTQSPVSITDAAGSPVRVLARADDEPLDHGTDVYSTKVASAPGKPARNSGL